MWSAPVMFCHPSTGAIVRVHNPDDALNALTALGVLIPAEARAAAYLALRRAESDAFLDKGRKAFVDALSLICPVRAPHPILLEKGPEVCHLRIEISKASATTLSLPQAASDTTDVAA